MAEKQDKLAWKWSEGLVNEKGEHIRIFYNQDPDPVALVSRGKKRSFVVQFIPPKNLENIQTGKIFEAVRKELDFYLVEKGEERPWQYAIYHCGTASDLYSKVHWCHHPKGYRDPNQRA